jgi:hypothetical protein
MVEFLKSLFDLMKSLAELLSSEKALPALIKLFSLDRIIAALIGFVLGLCLGIGRKWGREEKRQRRLDQQVLILKWRQMVHDILQEYEVNQQADPDAVRNRRSSVAALLEKQPDFASLMAELKRRQSPVITEIYAPRTFIGGTTIPSNLSLLRDEIESIAEEWDIPYSASVRHSTCSGSPHFSIAA